MKDDLRYPHLSSVSHTLLRMEAIRGILLSDHDDSCTFSWVSIRK